MDRDKYYQLRKNGPDREARDYQGEIFKRDVEEGLSLVLKGGACFAVAPHHPPWALLEALKGQLDAELDAIAGVRLDTPAITQQVQKALFAGGVRQSHIDGHPIRWVRGLTGLRWRVGDSLGGNTYPPTNLFAEARWLAAGHGIVKRPTPDSETVTWSRMVWLVDWDIDMPRFHASHNTYSTAWDEFAKRLLDLQVDFRNLVEASVSEGRVIASREGPAGSAFVPPAALRDENILESDQSIVFALSQDIPRHLLASSISLQNKKKNAVKWLRRAHEQFAPRRFSAADAEEAVITRFGISQNSARDVVRNSRSGKKIPGGKIPTKSRVSLKKLLEFS